MSLINGVLWGPWMLAAILGVGIWYSIRTGWLQITNVRLWFGKTMGALFGRGQAAQTEGGGISQFQALSTALAGTVGTGNIAGVASAIALGGPGAVFWMWISALVGMMTGFAEKALGIQYRYRDERGQWVGGAMVYIERGLKSRPLAVLYSSFCVLASLGMGNMAQSNSMAAALSDGFDIPPILTGVTAALLVALVTMGGIGRVGRACERLVPAMVCLFCGCALICLFANAGAIPGALSSIVREAFTPRSAAGGVMGYGMKQAMRMGVSRGVFSNEAGLGSSVIAHAQVDRQCPVEQGFVGMFEVFVDTIVMCSLTALVILTSGAYDMGTHLRDLALGLQPLEGAALTTSAMGATLGPWGARVVAVCTALFALGTVISWSFYGERCIAYAASERAVPAYRAVFCCAIAAGAVLRLSLVWQLSDAFNALMAIPNLLALALLSKEVIRMMRAYLNR